MCLVAHLVRNAAEERALEIAQPAAAHDNAVRPLLSGKLEDTIGGVALRRYGPYRRHAALCSDGLRRFEKIVGNRTHHGVALDMLARADRPRNHDMRRADDDWLDMLRGFGLGNSFDLGGML
jgi:hypothetical protein